jgi:hypothetical protein
MGRLEDAARHLKASKVWRQQRRLWNAFVLAAAVDSFGSVTSCSSRQPQ